MINRRDFLKSALTVAALAPIVRLAAEEGAGEAPGKEQPPGKTADGLVSRRRYKNSDLTLPLLGFGMMRLPRTKDGQIDKQTAQKMIDQAMAAGLNYFDTAWPYHGGKSELFAGEALSKYPRESYLLADKLPVRQIKTLREAEQIFNEQLKKCRTPYFDFYLLHALNASGWKTVERLGLYDFVRKMRDEGKIRKIGFSFHDTPEVLKTIASAHPWDFVLLQINYLDWYNYRSREQYEIVTELGIPVLVMEPLRGGTLASLTPAASKILKTSAPDASTASWALRYAASLPNVLCVLSGMTEEAHLHDNIRTFTPFKPLSDSERMTLNSALAAYRKTDSVPCTACDYCVPCPAEVQIPHVFSAYNQYQISGDKKAFQKEIASLVEGPSACVDCGTCIKKCPQQIKIPTELQRVLSVLK